MTDFSLFSNPLRRGLYKVDPRAFHHADCSFEPSGEVYEIGDVSRLRTTRQSNPITKDTDPALSARIFVGLSVDGVPTYSIDDVLKIVKKMRLAQLRRVGGDPGASFLLQRGLYKYTRGKSKGKTIPEDSVQVVILRISAESDGKFEANVGKIAEALAHKLKQEAVYAELQRDGVRYATLRAT